MSWFWRSKNESIEGSEAVDGLDPSLKEFLNHNTPGKDTLEEPASGAEDAIPYEPRGSVAQAEATSEAALENCALEHEALQECFVRGCFTEKMSLCQSKKEAFWDCFMQQKKTLRLLGYRVRPGQKEIDRDIQDHADDLYRKHQ